MAKFELEYCYDCMFLMRAAEVAQAILNAHQDKIEAFSLIPGHDGIFTLRLNGEVLYEIDEVGIPGRVEEFMKLVNERLAQP